VNFNYGLSKDEIKFEQSSEWIKDMYQEDALQILKLHGSLNWVSPYEKPKFLSLPSDKLGSQLDAAAIYSTAVHVYGDYDNVLKAERKPLLVPPTWRKAFGLMLNRVWARAVAAIQQAERIIIIGYSLPKTDVHIKYLLAAGLMLNEKSPTIWFVNPDKKLKSRVQEMFWGKTKRQAGPRIKFVWQKASQFFLDSAYNRQIGRDHPRFSVLSLATSKAL
jgi:hypothetical protein